MRGFGRLIVGSPRTIADSYAGGVQKYRLYEIAIECIEHRYGVVIAIFHQRLVIVIQLATWHVRNFSFI